MSPFGRYPSTFGAPNPSFPGLSTFPPREIPPLGLSTVHDPWRGYVLCKILIVNFLLIYIFLLHLNILFSNWDK